MRKAITLYFGQCNNIDCFIIVFDPMIKIIIDSLKKIWVFETTTSILLKSIGTKSAIVVIR